MASPNQPHPTDKKSQSSSSTNYVSSSGHVLQTPPFGARVSRTVDDIYNFLGLYLVSLFSLDPYTAAQNSQFNTRGRPNVYQERARWGGGMNRTGGIAGRRGEGGSGSGGSGGPNSSGGGGPGRRIGTVEDVRAPECGSCG